MASRLIHQHVLESPTDAGGIGPQYRRDACRKIAADRLHVLHHPAARPVDVSAVLEDDVDEREAEKGISSHHFYLRRRKQGGHDGVGHLIFNQVGTASSPFGKDDDLHVGEVGNGVEGSVS